MATSKWKSLAALVALNLLALVSRVLAGTGEAHSEPLSIPIGEEAPINVSLHEDKNFTSDQTYTLTLVQPNSTHLGEGLEFPCALSSAATAIATTTAAAATATTAATTYTSRSLTCLVSLDLVGTAIGYLRASSGDLWILLLIGYELPEIGSVWPLTMSSVGYGRLYMWLASGPLEHYDALIVRFTDSSGLTATSSLSVSSTNSSLLEGRAPGFSDFETNAELKVALSLNNGTDWTDTGFNITLEAKDKVKVGFIYVGETSDFGWTFQHNEARLYLEDYFYGQIETQYADNIDEWGLNVCDFCTEDSQWNASKEGGLGGWVDEPVGYVGTHRSAVTAKNMIDDGVSVIFSTSFYYQWDMYHLARIYPQISFIHCSGWLTRENMADTFPIVYQARYLSGIAVGSYIKEHSLPKLVGYASAYALGETVRSINAFKLGLEVIDADIKVYVIWLESWNDERREALGAKRLIQYYDVEAIIQHTDSTTPQIVARDLNKIGVGYNSDMLRIVGDTVLTSPILDWRYDYRDLLQEVLDGESLNNQNLWSGAEQGSWRLSDYSQRVPIEARLIIEEEYAKLRAGNDQIFCRENLMDNKGRIRNGATNPAVNPVAWEANHLIEGTTCLTKNVVNQMCQEYSNGDCIEFWLLDGVYDSCNATSLNPAGVTSPNLTAGECYLGYLNIPDECDSGTHLQLSGCVPAAVGSYAQDEVEYECASGYYSDIEGSDFCDSCRPGTYQDQEGASTCKLCPLGRYVDSLAATSCELCEEGEYSSVEGATGCTICDFGSYAADQGQTACTACPSGFVTLKMVETSASACVCDEGTYRPSTGGNDTADACLRCPDGMLCEAGSAEDNLPRNGEAATGTYPAVEYGYMSLADEPLEIYKCIEASICPGGPPATCASLRDTTSVGCGLCEDGAFETGGECQNCEGPDVLPAIGAAILLLLGLVAMVRMVNSNRVKQPRSLVTVGLLLVQLLAGIQTMGMFNQLSIAWFSPMAELFEMLSIFTFDLSVLRAACYLGSDPVMQYAFRQLLAPALIPLICLMLLIKRRSDPHLDFPVQAVNSVGAMISVFFISFVLSSSAPFWCTIEHPNGTSSMLESPSTLCWSTSNHVSIASLGVLGFILVPAPFVAFCVFATIKCPSYFADHSETAARKLHALRFIYVRFQPSRYWYGLVLLARNLGLAFVPMVVHEAGLQICVVFAILLLVTSTQQFTKPWLTSVANLTDSLLSNLLLLLLLCGFAATEMTVTNQWPIRALGVTTFVLFLGGAIAAIARSIYLFFVPNPWYEHFLCHHKGGAAAQARYLKIIISYKTKREVFIDSDDLVDLRVLFDIVKCRIGTLVVYLTEHTLARAWCAGEIVSAFASAKVNVVRATTPSFKEPPYEDLDELSLYLDTSGCNLNEHGISLNMVSIGYGRLLSDATVDIPAERVTGMGRQHFKLLGEAIITAGRRRLSQKKTSMQSAGQARPVPNNVVVVSDPRDDEATAAVGILLIKAQEYILGNVSEGIFPICDFDISNEDAVAAVLQSRACIILLSPGSLSCKVQLMCISEVVALQGTEATSPRVTVTKSRAAQTVTHTVTHSVTQTPSAGATVRIIPMALPNFVFPPESYYFDVLPHVWPEGLLEVPEYLRMFFKLIAVRFQTHDSDGILETQAKQIAMRVPLDTNSHICVERAPQLVAEEGGQSLKLARVQAI